MVMTEGLRKSLARHEEDKKSIWSWDRDGTMDGDPNVSELTKKFIAGVERNLDTLDDVLALFPNGVPIQAITKIDHRGYIFKAHRLPNETSGRYFRGPASFAYQVKQSHLKELRRTEKFWQFYKMRFIELGYGSTTLTSTAPTADPPTAEQSTKSDHGRAVHEHGRPPDLENARQSNGTQSVFINDGTSHCVVGAILNAFHDKPAIQAKLAAAFTDKKMGFMWHTEIGPWLHQSGLAAQERLKVSESSQ